jgi:hypothetical protein
MKKTLKALLAITVTFGMLTVSGCKKDKNNDDNGGGSSTSKNTVTGIVKDVNGNPIAGATVRIENDFNYYDVTTNAQGKYSCTVVAFGSYKALAWAPVTYNGANYILRVGMPNASDYDHFDPRNGAVRNFQLQHKGRIQDRTPNDNGTGYFGMSINFYKLGSLYGPQWQDGDIVKYMLTPVGPLMDGTAGQVLQGSFNIQSTNAQYYAVDVPAGKYKVDVRINRGGIDYMVFIGPNMNTGNQSIEISPKYGDYGTGTYESGFEHPSNVVYMTLQ